MLDSSGVVPWQPPASRCIGLDDGKEIPPDFSLTQFLRVK